MLKINYQIDSPKKSSTLKYICIIKKIIKLIKGDEMDRKKLAIDFAKSLEHSEIEKIILYGSVARGDDNKDSDIDILIIIHNHSDKKKIKDDIHAKTFNILLKTGEFISTKFKSMDHCEKYKDFSYFKTINKEGILIS